MSNRALVTGATGFIGERLARRLLADGHEVHLLVREASQIGDGLERASVHRLDASDSNLPAIVAEARPDIVFHLASLYLAEHRPQQVEDLVLSNILFPARLVEAMVGAGVKRLVNTGTAWQHFGTTGYNPVNLYAATKQAFDDLLRFYHDARGLSVVTLKLFDTYGAGDKRRKLVQLLVDAAQTGDRLGMSPGEQVVDITHVEDVVDAFLLAGDRLMAAVEPVEESFFVSGQRLTLRALASTVGDALGGPGDVAFGERPYREREVMRPVDVEGTVVPRWTPRRRLQDTLSELKRR